MLLFALELEWKSYLDANADNKSLEVVENRDGRQVKNFRGYSRPEWIGYWK